MVGDKIFFISILFIKACIKRREDLSLIHRIKRWLFKEFQQNFVIYFVVIILFGIGIIAGAITIKILNLEQRNGIMVFLNIFFKAIEQGSFDNLAIFKQSLIDNLKTVALIYLTGLIIIGLWIIPVIVLFRGFALGFTVGFLVNEYSFKGFIFSLLGILPQNLIIIPAFIFISAIGIAFSIKNAKNKKLRYINSNIHMNITNYSIQILVASVLIVVGCFIEAYIAPKFLGLIWDYFN